MFRQLLVLHVLLFPLSALTAAPVGASTPGPAIAQSDDGARESLEDFLRRARASRDAARAAMTAEVTGVLEAFESLTPRTRERDAARLRKQLVDLGTEVAPLLVDALDPGPEPSSGVTFRCAQVVQVLGDLAAASITDRLLQLSRKGIVESRVNALAVLRTSPEPGRVAPVVRDLYRTAEGTVRQAALVTLASMGGKEATALLVEALSDEDAEIVDLALRSLGAAKNLAVSEDVRRLASGERGPTHVESLTDYYAEFPDLVEESDHLLALIGLAAHNGVPRDAAVRLITMLTELEIEPRSSAKRALEPLTKHVNDELREATLALLARAGDKGARRRLLEPYTDRISRQRDFDRVYTERGDVYYRIAEYPSAIKDYKQAIELRSRRASSAPEPYLGMARCYARMKRYKDAATQLEDAPVSLLTLRELADDPAFALMLETRYRDAFALPK